MRIDLRREPAVPGHDDASVLVDLVDDCRDRLRTAPSRRAEPRRARSLLRSQRRPEGELRGVVRPGCPYDAYRFRRAKAFNLRRETDAEGLQHASTKSRRAGGSLRTRRLRVDPSASRTAAERAMTSADHSRDEDKRGGLVRRVLSPGPNPEERLEELLADRRRELDEHAERLHESIAELERREELLRDSRASVERVLRIGTSDLEAREAELTSYLRDLTDRETHLTAAEEDLARRRQELGAVELKRADGRTSRARRRGARSGSSKSARRIPRTRTRARLRRSSVRAGLRPRRGVPTRRARPRPTRARARVRGERRDIRRRARRDRLPFPAIRDAAPISYAARAAADAGPSGSS